MKTLILCMLLCLIHISAIACTGNSSASSGINSGELFLEYYSETTPTKYLFADCEVIKSDGSFILGNYLGIIDSSVHILDNKKDISININNIEKLMIFYRDNCQVEFGEGVLTGMYLGGFFNQSLLYSESENWRLMRKKDGTFIIFALSGAAAVSSLIYTISKPERRMSIDFARLRKKGARHTQEGINKLNDKYLTKSLHFKMQFGNISKRMLQLGAEGYSINENRYGYYNDHNQISIFSILRSFSVQISTLHNFDFGVSYYNLNEPGANFNEDPISFNINMLNSAYFLTGEYYLFRDNMADCLELGFGFGAGLSFSEIWYDDMYNSNWLNDRIILESEKKEESKFCYIVYSDFGYRVSDAITLGLSVDILSIPGGFELPKVNKVALIPENVPSPGLFFRFYLKYNFLDYYL